MKYYAVTEDPTELMHYGVKGMKWGQHLFGDKPKSPAFKKAATKLRASMKNGIKKTKANWKKTSEKRQANKDFKEAKLNAQAEARLNEALGKQANRAAKQEQRAIRREMHKENAAERREERQMNRYLQKARQGTLKYKKIRDDQVQAIAERLNLENQARRLSGNETPHMLTRIKRSIGEGVVRGVGAAVATGIEQNALARAKYKAEKKYGAKTDRAKLKAKQKNAQREARAKADEEFYEMQAESGERRTFNQVVGPRARQRRMRELADYKARKKENERQNTLIENAMRRDKGEDTGKYLKRIMDNDWREKIGYQGYAPDPKARVRFISQVKNTLKTPSYHNYTKYGVNPPSQSSQDTDVYAELSTLNKPIVKRRKKQYKGHLETRYDLFGV